MDKILGPVSGRKPETIKLIEKFKLLKEDEIISYETLLDICEETDINQIRGYVSSAMRVTQREYGIVMNNIRGIGYKRLNSSGMVHKGKTSVESGVKKIVNGAKTVAYADINELTDDEKKAQMKISNMAYLIEMTGKKEVLPNIENTDLKKESNKQSLMSLFS